jgi:hypothetical protein
MELYWKWVSWRGSSPAADYREGTSSGFCDGQRNWLNSCSVGEWNRYLKVNTDIIEGFCWRFGWFTPFCWRSYKLLDNFYSIANSVCLKIVGYH